MIEILSVSSVSATLEIQNDKPFYSGYDYEITLNGKPAGKTDRNVFSLFELEPGTEYRLELNASGSRLETSFHTKKESFALNVRDFGAAGDGITLDTAAIQAAIAACPKDGRVYFPAGTYLSTPIFPKSDMTLELKEGATLLGAKERSLYPMLPGYVTNKAGEEYLLGCFEGSITPIYAALVSVLFVQNLTITGRGTIDGSASRENWWQFPSPFSRKRPRLCYFFKSDNITLEGVTVQNSPAWTIHPLFCTNSRFLSLRINNPADSPNTDGLNPELSENILIAGVHFSVGDDCIAIKAGKIEMGEKGFGPTKNINVRNNLMEFGHGGVVVGSEVGGGIRDVFVSKCVFRDTDRGLRIKSRRGRGERSVIDNIRMENVFMDRVWTPFAIYMFYHCGPDGHDDYVQNKNSLPIDHRTPTVGSVFVENIVCKNSMTAAGIMYGLPERKIRHVVMKNVEIHMDDEGKLGLPAMMDGIDEVKRAGVTLVNVEKIEFENVNIINQEGEAVTIENVDELIRR